jgi:parallel beta-helix repeat protein
MRDLSTGVQLRGGSEVEVINNTLVRNTNGLVAEGTNPVNVRNSIFAHHTRDRAPLWHQPHQPLQYLQRLLGQRHRHGEGWRPPEPSLGTLVRRPPLPQPGGERPPLAGGLARDRQAGAPADPTTPGGGARVDMGYAEYNAAGFYVSQNYSETGLNDGLTWGWTPSTRSSRRWTPPRRRCTACRAPFPQGGYSVGVDAGTYTETVSVPSHVRLVGSGAEVTILDAGAAGSAVTFDGVIDAELSGFTLQNASSSGAGVALANAASGITISRNVIRNNAGHGVSLAGSSSAAIRFNTIVGNAGAGVYASGQAPGPTCGNNILNGNAAGLQAASNGLIRNAYNLLHNTTALSGVTAGDGTLTTAPAFAGAGYYVPSAASPAIDAAEPWAVVPLAGGLRADLGYKELIASPLTLVFGPQIDSTVTGNSGVARVEVGVVLVSDATKPVTATLPATWTDADPGPDRPAAVLLVAEREPGDARPLPGLQPGDRCGGERRNRRARLVRRRVRRRQHRAGGDLGRDPAREHRRCGGVRSSRGGWHGEHRHRDA